MITVLSTAGIGDFILSLQCTAFMQDQHEEEILNVCAARDEVWNPILHIFGDDFRLRHEDEETIKDIEISDEIAQQFEKKYSKFYFILPDYLYRNPHAFDYKKYKTNPLAIRSRRILLHRRLETQKIIYVALASTTPGYLYGQIGDIILKLATALPQYEIYCPLLTRWADQSIDYGYLPDIRPPNLNISFDKAFAENYDVLRRAEICICADNGISHLAYNLGVPRILIDPQFGKAAWLARWRQDFTESIPMDTPPLEILRIVKTMVEIPESILLPRKALNLSPSVLKDKLILKF